MPLPLIVGAAAVAGGAALIAWYERLPKKRQKEVDDWSLSIFQASLQKKKTDNLNRTEARKVIKKIPEKFRDAPKVDVQDT